MIEYYYNMKDGSNMDNNQRNENQNIQLFSDNSQVFVGDNTSNCNQNNYVNDKVVYNPNGYLNSNISAYDSIINSDVDSINNSFVFNDNINNIFDNSDLLNVSNGSENNQDVFFDTGDNVRNKVIEVEFIGTKNKVKKNNKLISIIMNKKLMLTGLGLILIFTVIVVGKNIYLKDIEDTYKDFFTIIEEKESLGTVIYNDSIIINSDENIKMGAADELVNCIKSPLKLDELPDSINSIVDELNKYYNESNNYFAFKYKDIYTGFSISHNENQGMYAASMIKAPKDIYVYEMASLGKIDLDEKLTYTSNYYNTGTGFIKNSKFGTEYTVRDLLMYSTVYSDNVAHNMLMDKYGRNNMLSFWKEKGTNVIFTENNNWGVINAHDAIIYMEELYKFFVDDDTYGKELMNNFLEAKTKFIKGKNGYKVANKSGWSGTAIHDVSIVFADNPYIVVALSNLGRTEGYMSYFNKVNDLAYRLHTEYWKYKMDMCGDIIQY